MPLKKKHATNTNEIQGRTPSKLEKNKISVKQCTSKIYILFFLCQYKNPRKKIIGYTQIVSYHTAPQKQKKIILLLTEDTASFSFPIGFLYIL
jgi:hypothetical protein